MRKITLIFTLIFTLTNSQKSFAGINDGLNNSVFKINNDLCLTHSKKANENGSENLLLETGRCNESISQYKVLDEIEVPNDSPKLEWILSQEINHQNYIIVLISYDEDFRDQRSYLNYTKYYISQIYMCTHDTCITDTSKIQKFVSSGGDLKNFNTNKYLETYPYKSKAILEKDLNSNWFQDWINHRAIKGYLTKNTELKADEYIFAKTKQRLNKNLNFTLLDIRARKLKISFIDKKGTKIQGWIKCEDTNLCQDNLQYF